RVESRLTGESAIVLGTLTQLRQSASQLAPTGTIDPDGFWIRTVRANGTRFIVITAQNDRGVLYGAFALLRRIAAGEPITEFEQKEAPYSPVRWVNHWDNL